MRLRRRLIFDLGLVWFSILGIVLGGCGSRGGEFPRSGSAAGFNLVLITLDTTRADHLGSYGYSKAETPHLDRLAREGIRFADAVSPAPMTLVSHTSILTGLDPDHHGVRNNGQFRLDPSRVTLAETLAPHGYQTAAFVSSFVLDARYGLAQGFQEYDDRVEPFPAQPFSGLGERPAKAVTDSALLWLEKRSRSQPFFLWVHYYDPHSEYKPPEEFARRFPGDPYDGEIAYMDSQIGRLLTALQEAGKLLVIVAGDHGESFGEHNEYAHSRLIYETTQHVPLILWSPQLIHESRVVDDAVVGLVDIFPTVVDLLGIEDSGKVDGRSLRLGREDPDRAIYIETMAPYLESGWAPLQGLRRHRDKYIFAPKPEYYDLVADPGESRNLYGQPTGRAATVSRLVNELQTRLEQGPSPESVAASASAPDAESLRQLQALGYLRGGGSPHPVEGSVLPDPKDMMGIQALLMASRGLRKEGRLEEALGKAKQALETAPKDPEVLEENGLVYIEMNRLGEAEQALRAYSALKPNPNIDILLAEILAETGRSSEGEALLRRAMELEPDHGGVMITLGDLLAAEGKYGKAMEWYQKAKRVDPYRATEIADRRIVDLRRRASGS